MTTPLIELDGLTQAYGNLVALKGLTGAIPPASVGLVGANGAGKSTLMKVLLGILKPTSGSARVLGLSVTDEIIALRSSRGRSSVAHRPRIPPMSTSSSISSVAATRAWSALRASRTVSP